MKSSKTVIYSWGKNNIHEHQDDTRLDIDWPAVQREVGVDCVEWLLEQDDSKCQLMLELTPQGGKQLVVEFYDEKTAVSYHMMWAK
jgi:hypothetical protein